MASKITKLTQEQKDMMPTWVEKWTKIGLSCEPIDIDLSAKYISECYQHSNLEPPKHFIKALSPMGLIMTYCALDNVGDNVKDNVWANVGDNVRANVRANVGDNVRANVWANVWDNIRVNVWANVRDNVMANVWANVGDNVWANVWANVMANVRDNVGDNVWDNVGDNVRDNVGANIFCGNLSPSWCACESFLHEVCGLVLDRNLSEKAVSFRNATASCGWWYPTTNIVIICDRPAHIDFENGVLHSATRLAIQWRDGLGIAMWRGVSIPNEWITDRKPTAKELLAWKNIEQRRCGFELIGWDSILAELKAVMIDSNQNPEIGDLYEVDLPDSGKERFIKVLCGTGRSFVIPVDPKCNTALEAQAWSYGLDNNDLLPEIRT